MMDTHLPRPRLREVTHNEDLLRRGERTDDLAHLEREFLDEPGLFVLVVLELPIFPAQVSILEKVENSRGNSRFESDERVHGLASELVRSADN